MPISVDSIASLRAFVAAAEANSFKVGGQALGLTSSAIGKSIARLEQQLAVQLFHRTTRTLSLTEAGALFLARTRTILDQLEAAEGEIASAATELRGPLRVSVPLTGGAMSKPLADFVARHPAVQLDLNFSDRLVDVIGEGFDAVIRTGSQRDSRLLQHKLGSFAWCLAASPAYLDRAGTPRHPADLAAHACLRQRVSTGRIAPWPLREQQDMAIPTTLTSGIIDPLVDMVVAGAGIAAFPGFMIQEHLETGRMIEVLPGSMERTSVLHILWPSSRYPLPKTKALVSAFSEWADRTIRR